jgi:hypothetical protein
MPTLTLTGPGGATKQVDVDAGFTSLSAAQQQDTVAHIAGQIWPSTAAPAGPQPSMARSAAAGASAGFGRAVLGTEQLAGEGLSGLGKVLGPAGFIDRPVGAALQADAAKRLATVAQQEAPYSAAHPIATGIGEVAGAAPAALVAPEGELAPAATWSGRLAQAARTGGVIGAEQPVDTSKTGPAYWEAKAKETGENIATSAAFGQGAEAAQLGISGIGKFAARHAPETVNSTAVRKILSRIAQDEKGGGPKAKDVIEAVRTGRALGTPTTLMEAGGANVRGLAGAMARAKGSGRQIIASSFKDRLLGARQRLLSATQQAFEAPETMRTVRRGLSASQRAAAAPLYEEAMKPGSVAPLEKQFEDEFNAASQARQEANQGLQDAKNAVTQAAAKLHRAGDDVYSNSAAIREMKDAQANVDTAHAAVRAADQRHQETLTSLRQAQQEEAAGNRGGVWSPYIARLLQNPKVQQGIQAGLRIQRDEADADNTVFNPRDYAITGYDQNGNPTIAKVPNMRLLDSAKKGLDAMLEQHRSEITGRLELGPDEVQINRLRASLVRELDRLNPSYKAARDAWAGPAASKGAMAIGRKILTMHPEDVEEIFNRMSPAEQEHYKIGAAQAYLDAIGKRGVIAGEVRELAEEDTASTARQRLLPIFKSQQKLDDFLKSVEGERAIHSARADIIGGSQTRARTVEDEAPDIENALHAGHVAAHVMHGNYLGAALSTLRMIRDRGLVQDPAVNDEVARILSDPNVDLSAVEAAQPPSGSGLFSNSALTSALGAGTVAASQERARQ